MKTRFELNQLDNGNWNAVDTLGDRVLISANVTLEEAETACAKRRNKTTDIISRMEAIQSRFGRFAPAGRLQLTDREVEAAADWIQDGDPPALAGESEAEYNERTGRYDQ